MELLDDSYRSIRTTECHDVRYGEAHEAEQKEVSTCYTFPDAGKFHGLFSSRPRPPLPRRQIMDLHRLREDLERQSQYSIVYEFC